MKKYEVTVHGASYCLSGNTFASEKISVSVEGESEDQVLAEICDKRLICFEGRCIPTTGAALIVVAEAK